MRKLLMIAAFAAFTACAKQSDTDVGETTPQTDEATTTTPPADQTTPPADATVPAAEPSAPAPSTGYEPLPSTTDTLQTPSGDSAATERAIPDTSSTALPPTTGTTTYSMMTTAPDSL